MSVLNQIIDQFPSAEECVRIENFDHCIIGFDEMDNRLVYDISLMLGSMIDDGMTEDEAQEFMSNNILGSDAILIDGPIFIHSFKL